MKIDSIAEEILSKSGLTYKEYHLHWLFYLQPLTGLDLLLGVQWLEQLGPVVCNWQMMTMEFH